MQRPATVPFFRLPVCLLGTSCFGLPAQPRTPFHATNHRVWRFECPSPPSASPPLSALARVHDSHPSAATLGPTRPVSLAVAQPSGSCRATPPKPKRRKKRKKKGKKGKARQRGSRRPRRRRRHDLDLDLDRDLDPDPDLDLALALASRALRPARLPSLHPARNGVCAFAAPPAASPSRLAVPSRAPGRGQDHPTQPATQRRPRLPLPHASAHGRLCHCRPRGCLDEPD